MNNIIINTGCGSKPKATFKSLYAKLKHIEHLVGKYQHLYHKSFEAEHFGYKYTLSTRARNWELQWLDLYKVLSTYHSEQFNREQTKRGVALNYNFGDLLA